MAAVMDLGRKRVRVTGGSGVFGRHVVAPDNFDSASSHVIPGLVPKCLERPTVGPQT